MNVNPYLLFEGRCEEAFRFYAELLGAEIQALMPFRGAPGCEDMPEAMQDQIIHGCLKLDDTLLMASDCPPGSYQAPAGQSVALQADSPEEAERVFGALCEGGTVTMPMEETFWALRFGVVTDRFGTPWMVNCSRPEEGCTQP